MNDLEEHLDDGFGDHLSDTFARLAERAPHRPDLARTVRRRVRHRRLVTAAVVSVSGLAAATAGALTLSADRAGHHAQDPAVTPVAACRSTVVRGVLPDWARTGFSDPEPVMPYVRSASGDVVAIMFNDGLEAPASPQAGNKVLWVWKRLPAAVGDIRATARREGSGPPVVTFMPTPVGPSSVRLDAPGCWRLTLTWPGGSDSIDLRADRPKGADRRESGSG
jgi:hypothetical protein